MTHRFTIRARVLPDGLPITLTGRNAETLRQLVAVGERGLTTIEHPAPRVAHYVMCLRRSGFIIETLDEKHGGQFPGVHGRYILRSKVEILAEPAEAQEAA